MILAVGTGPRGTHDTSCGDGSDRIEVYSGEGLLARRDCERVRFPPGTGPDIDPRPSPPTGRVCRMYLRCDASEPLVVRTAAVSRPWFTAGPFGVEVARAPAPHGPFGQLCPVEFTLTDAGQALLDELPVDMPTGRYDMIALLLPSN